MLNPTFKLIILLVFAVILVGSFLVYRHLKPEPLPFNTPKNNTLGVTSEGKVKYPQDFTMVLVGDSMTERLGNSDEIKGYLTEYYPDKTFEVLNYGFGATNILSLPERLTQKTFHTREFRPILDIDFDLIIIESFGHNPLSEFPLEEGLKKQNETLDQALALIEKSNPRSKIAFLATISPNSKRYGESLVDLTEEKRGEWAHERVEYINNHIRYALEHNIPIINVFEKSLNSSGDGNLEYIHSVDFIHPSPNGVHLISREIADFIHQNQLVK